MKAKIFSWSNYLFLGLAFAMVLSLLDKYRDGFYQVILVGVFFVVCGIKNNFNKLKEYILEYKFFAFAVVLWFAYFTIKKPELLSNRYAITAFVVIFAGYIISHEGEEVLKNSLDKMWLLLFAVEIAAIVKYLIAHDFETRMSFLFTNPIAEGDATIILALISLFYIDTKWKKYAGIILSFAVMITGSLRMDLAVLILIFALYAIDKRKIIYVKVRTKLDHIGKKRAMLLGVAVLAIGIIGVVAIVNKKDSSMVEVLYKRYLAAFASITRDVYLNVYGDLSLKIRIIAIDQALRNFRLGGFFKNLLGHGMLSGYYAIKPSITMLIGVEAEDAGPIENAFIALLSDYGALAFILYFGTYISAIYSYIKSKVKAVRISAVFVVVIMTLSAFIDMEYWINLVFFLWIFIGIYLGNLVKADEKYCLLPSLMLSTIIAINLYYMPATYAFCRTLMNSLYSSVGKSIALITIFFAVALYVVSMWGVCVLSSYKIIYKQKVSKTTIVGTLAALIMLTVITTGGVCSIKKAKATRYDIIEGEKEIITIIKDNASGQIYSDIYPLMYKETFGNIQGTLFSGSSIAPIRNTTVIVSKDREQYLLSKAGFLYLPISDSDAIYTNDEEVIKALNQNGYNLTGYNTEVRETRIIRSSDEKVHTYEPLEDTVVYSGEYDAIFKLKLKANDIYKQDQQICTLAVSNKNDKKPIAEKSIVRSQFNEQGELEYPVHFSCYSNCYFTVCSDIADNLSVESVKYMRSPSVDRRIDVDDFGRPIIEENYDFEGNPTLGPEGSYALEFEYGDTVKWTVKRYLGMDLQKCALENSCAEVHREFNENKLVSTELYYDLTGQLTEINEGYSSIEYEYTEEGKVSKKTYKNLEGKIVKQE